jgi:endonuclease YncB( thermonuclease family)
MKRLPTFLALLLLCVLSAAAQNNVKLVIEGKVINVHDGDTITVLDKDDKKFHIRLQGIDAPEIKQKYGA